MPVEKAYITSSVLVWARDRAGLTLRLAAEKANVSEEALTQWEAGDDILPSLPQARKLAALYKRPLAVLYLPGPPRDFQPKKLPDYRKTPALHAAELSPQLTYEIRRAQDRRTLATELYHELEGVDLPELPLAASLTMDPDALANTLREYLGVTIQDQIGWKNEFAAFAALRFALETAGVLVFQSTRVNLAEFRGLSISERPFPAIVVNNKDRPHGKIFSLLHELTHIALKQSGLCDLTEGKTIEIFCNRVAGAALVPQDILLSEPLVQRTTGKRPWEDQELSILSKRFKVSEQVILRRLLICARTTKEFYQTKHAEYDERYARLPAAGGPVSFTEKVLNRAGTRFTSIILDSYSGQKITALRAANYLDVPLKYLEPLQGAIFERTS